MLEEDRVPLGQRHLGDGHQLTLDLAGGVREPELGHVPQPRRLGPAGVGDEVLLVERSAALEAACSVWLVLSLTPLALDPVHFLGMPF
jgi:hypothetical protein